MLKFLRDYLSCYIAHLDWIRLLHVSLEMSGLPMVYTEGYSTKAKMKLSPPLPVGLQSKTELALIYLRENISENLVGQSLEETFPDGIEIQSVMYLHPSPPKNPFHAINGAQYEMRFPGDPDEMMKRRIIEMIKGENMDDSVSDIISKQHGLIVKILNEDLFINESECLDYVARLEGGRTFHPVKFALGLYETVGLPHVPQGRRLSFLSVEEEGARKLFDF